MICRICDGNQLDLAIDLGRQPWANHFLLPDEVGRESVYPLRVVLCGKCHAAQLDYTVPKETMFGNHTYLSGVTASLNAHFKSVAEHVDSMYFRDKSGKAVLDIGSNDGTQLRHFKSLGYDVLGVESSRNIATLANQANINTLNSFFNLEVARILGRRFDVINAAGVFFHLEELHSVTEGIRELLRDGGVFVVQFIYMKRILENNSFDQIYHEHLLYYNLETIEALLNRHGLAMFDAYESPIHGGSVIAFVAHQNRMPVSPRLSRLRAEERTSQANSLGAYRALARRIEKLKKETLAYLALAKAKGRTVFGLGAPVKGNTLLNYLGVTKTSIACLVEKNPLRKGLFAPGSHIPVILESDLPREPDIYYVLAWNFKNEILANYKELIGRGVKFAFPFNPKNC